jgi:hypothetical protein
MNYEEEEGQTETSSSSSSSAWGTMQYCFVCLCCCCGLAGLIWLIVLSVEFSGLSDRVAGIPTPAPTKKLSVGGRAHPAAAAGHVAAAASAGVVFEEGVAEAVEQASADNPQRWAKLAAAKQQQQQQKKID